MLSKRIVKYIQSLSQKKLRDELGQFIAETPKVVREFLLAKNYSCKILCADKIWLYENAHLLENILPATIYEITDTTLQKISLLKAPNQVLGVFEKKLTAATPLIAGKLTLMLDEIQDPGNLGTIIRNADWFAIENIICSKNCADCYNPKVIQASMGSLARVNVHYHDLDSFLETNKQISVYAATLDGTPLAGFKNIAEGIVLMGNESRGISEGLLSRASRRITIPGYGAAESLNVAVAAGIILSGLRSVGPVNVAGNTTTVG